MEQACALLEMDHCNKAIDMLHEFLHALLAGKVDVLTIEPDGQIFVGAPPPGVILSGAFNPLHRGHTALLAAAAGLVERAPRFELALRNADKGGLAVEQIVERARQFAQRATLLLACEPLFTGKALRYPGSDFVLGYDTAERLLAPHYYGGMAGLEQALALVQAQGCRFIVAGRLVNGQFQTLQNLVLPATYKDLFIELPEAHFRADISSSALRMAERE